MTLSDIADRLGVTKQRVQRIAKHKTNGFPVPAVTLRSGRLWQRADIEAWALQRSSGHRPAA